MAKRNIEMEVVHTLTYLAVRSAFELGRTSQVPLTESYEQVASNVRRLILVNTGTDMEKIGTKSKDIREATKHLSEFDRALLLSGEHYCAMIESFKGLHNKETEK